MKEYEIIDMLTTNIAFDLYNLVGTDDEKLIEFINVIYNIEDRDDFIKANLGIGYKLFEFFNILETNRPESIVLTDEKLSLMVNDLYNLGRSAIYSSDDDKEYYSFIWSGKEAAARGLTSNLMFAFSAEEVFSFFRYDYKIIMCLKAGSNLLDIMDQRYVIGTINKLLYTNSPILLEENVLSTIGLYLETNYSKVNRKCKVLFKNAYNRFSDFTSEKKKRVKTSRN